MKPLLAPDSLTNMTLATMNAATSARFNSRKDVVVTHFWRSICERVICKTIVFYSDLSLANVVKVFHVVGG